MNRLLGFLLIASVLLITLSGFSCRPQDVATVSQSTVTTLVQDFSALGSDDKMYSLSSLTAGGKTLVLYFVKRDCGANRQAVPLFRDVSAPFLKSDKLNFVIVFNDGKQGFESFEDQYGFKSLGLLDPEQELIKAFQIRRSQSCLVVKGGKIVKIWTGFSRSSFSELGAIMSESSGIPFDVDLSRAQVREGFG